MSNTSLVRLIPCTWHIALRVVEWTGRGWSDNMTHTLFVCFSYSHSYIIGKAVADFKTNKYVKNLLNHITKMLNIFHHVYTNQKPLFVPKGQKTDLFVGSKELQLLNSWSYFGNDYFYLNLYRALRVSFDAYKVNKPVYTILLILEHLTIKISIILEPSWDGGSSTGPWKTGLRPLFFLVCSKIK